MATNVFVMVWGAAILHAAWNALVKVNADRLVMIAIMMMSQVAMSMVALPFVAFPTAESWPYIWASCALNTGYCLFLINSYRYGDLSHVYPISRGVAPLIVAFISVVVIGETLSLEAALSVALIALGNSAKFASYFPCHRTVYYQWQHRNAKIEEISTAET